MDPRFEHDSCGVGFVATTRGDAAHNILEHALTALARLAHRGAVAADGASSDGVGVMTAIPREYLLASAGLSLAAEAPLAVGMLFCPAADDRAQALVKRCLAQQGLQVLGWRAVAGAG